MGKDTDFLHVYDWLDQPASNAAEADAKEWLSQFCRPAIKKDHMFLDRHQVTVEWKGKRYICSGASRMGDVWLKSKESSSFYDHRVNVNELSSWKRVTLPNEKIPKP